MVEGLFEQYYMMDHDVCKDSAMECTVLSLAIAKAKTMLADRGLRLPEFLSIKYDNTGREGEEPDRCDVDVVDTAPGSCSAGARWEW